MTNLAGFSEEVILQWRKRYWHILMLDRKPWLVAQRNAVRLNALKTSLFVEGSILHVFTDLNASIKLIDLSKPLFWMSLKDHYSIPPMPGKLKSKNLFQNLNLQRKLGSAAHLSNMLSGVHQVLNAKWPRKCNSRKHEEQTGLKTRDVLTNSWSEWTSIYAEEQMMEIGTGV